MTIQEICIRAIPFSECPVKRMNEVFRRERLAENIQKLLDEQRKQLTAIVQPILQNEGSSGNTQIEENY